MLKHESIPTLTPELMLDGFNDYPEEVLECEWNPALEQVLRLREQRRRRAESPRLLYAEPPELPTSHD